MDVVFSEAEPDEAELQVAHPLPLSVEFEEVFRKVDEMSDSLRQPNVSEACSVLVRYMATPHKYYNIKQFCESIEQRMSEFIDALDWNGRLEWTNG